MKNLLLCIIICSVLTTAVWTQNSRPDREACGENTVKKSVLVDKPGPVRFDGMYAGVFGNSNSYLRFYEDGEVAGVNIQAIRTASEIKRRRDQSLRSTYKIEGNKITLRIVHTATREYCYEGTIDEKGMTIDFYGNITPYTFVPSIN